MVTGFEISNVAIALIIVYRIHRICLAGFRKKRRMTNTIGRNIKPPRDRVSRIEMTIGTSVKACMACPHHFFERVMAKIATKKNAIKNAAYVLGY
ncbi:hypothetical protein D1872_226960 [compost metagenome]